MSSILLRRPLVDLTVIRAFSDKSERAIIEALDTGQLFPVWNIATNGASRTQLRVWTRSALDWIEARQQTQPDPDSLARSFLPPDSTIGTIALTKILFCGPEHLRQLLKQRSLAASGSFHRGRGGEIQFTRASVLNFLARRLYAG